MLSLEQDVNGTRFSLSCKPYESKVVYLKKCAKCSLKCKEADSKNYEIFRKSILELESLAGFFRFFSYSGKL